MALILGFRVQNFKSLKDITLGRFWDTQTTDALTPLTAVIGKNGVGKSTLFDTFGFLADCVKLGVEDACDARGRGGLQRLLSQGSEGPLAFQVYFKQDGNARPITYELEIVGDAQGRPYVAREHLRQRRRGQSYGRPYSFLKLENGIGRVWKGETATERDEEPDEGRAGQSSDEEPRDGELIELSDKRKLAVATLGALKQHPRISAFRSFIEGWYLSYFRADAARGLPMAGPQKHLNARGDNLGNVVQYMQREHPRRFKTILARIAEKIPGIHSITTEKTNDGRLLLCFNDRGFQEPFFAPQMSDGTLKVFAYLLLLEDPDPPPFLCIEEPENGLYHKLLETLIMELREHTGRKSQVFLTTHQPYLVDALQPNEVWVLKKGDDGFSSIHRADSDPLVQNLVEQELPLGGLWYSDYLDAR